MSLFEEIHCKTADDLMDKLSPHHELWMWNGYLKSPANLGWIYRGQGNAKWELTPSAWRKTKTCNSVIELRTKLLSSIYSDDLDKILVEYDQRYPNPHGLLFVQYEREQIIKCIIASYAEYSGILEFIELSNKLGLYVPSFSGFRDQGDGFFHTYLANLGMKRPTFIWSSDATALGQHHGIPTRLLDWTLNAKKAAFFAYHSHKGSSRIAIYALYTPVLNHQGGNVIKTIYVETRQNDFLRVQEALFTLDTSGDSYFLRNGRYPSMEETLEQIKCGNVGYKLTLPNKELANLLHLLRVENIHRASLMPTYDNVSQQAELDWKSYQ